MRPSAIIPAQDAKGTVNVMRFRLRWDEPNVALGVWKATAQRGIQFLPATARVITPFDGTTPSVTVGTDGAQSNMFGTADITEAGATVVPVNTPAAVNVSLTTPIFARGIFTGATAGEVEFVIPFNTP